MGWLQLVGSIKIQVSFAKETYKRETILQKRPIILCVLCSIRIYITLLLRMSVMTHRMYDMGWLWLVGSLKLQVSFAKEPYKRDDILQRRPIILRSLLTVATPYDSSNIWYDSIDTWDMTQFIYVTLLFEYISHYLFECMIWLNSYTWDMTHSYVWHDSLICVTWLIDMCDITHWYVWNDSFTYQVLQCVSRR